MPLSPQFLGALQRLSGEWDCWITGTKDWGLTYFSKGPPPIAIAYLQRKRSGLFFEELVKLSDIRTVLDARSILVADLGAIKPDAIQLATNLGVYVIIDSDETSLQEALRGVDVSEVNRASQIRLLRKKRRSASQECRSLILNLLSKKWMTLQELEEQLKWRFDRRTVRFQARELQHEGKLSVLGRTKFGEGLLGLPTGHYHVRQDLSVSTMNLFLAREILYIMEGKEKPLTYREISEKLWIKGHVATAILRELASKGAVEKSGSGWKIKRLTK
jgi:hypothetical protein